MLRRNPIPSFDIFKGTEKIKRDVENIRNYGLADGIKYNIEEDIKDAKTDISNSIEQVKSFANNPIGEIEKQYKSVLGDLTKVNKTKDLKYGDIIAVSRSLPYQHYAVYIGNNRVIHFASSTGDFGGKNTVHEAPFEEFLRDSNSFEILEFEEHRSEPVHYQGRTSAIIGGYPSISAGSILSAIIEAQRDAQYHLYTPSQTVERAKLVARNMTSDGRFQGSFDGKHYNLIFNNCEHFAIWCKTGVSESRQVDQLLSSVLKVRKY